MAKMSSKQRNKLDDSEFGLPEKRMYPLNDKAHVESAVKLFGHCPDADKPELARRILAKAKEFGMDSSGWTQVNTWAAKGKDYKKNNKKGDIKKESYIYTPDRWTYNPTVYSEFYQEAADGEQSGLKKFLEGIKKMWIKFIESLINLWSKIVDFFHGVKVKKLLKKLEKQTVDIMTFTFRSADKDKNDAFEFISDIRDFTPGKPQNTRIGTLINLIKEIDDSLKKDDIYECIRDFNTAEFRESMNKVKRLFSKDSRPNKEPNSSISKDHLIELIKYVSDNSDLSAIRRMRYRVRKLKSSATEHGYVGDDIKKFAKDLRADGTLLIKFMHNYQSSMVYAYKNLMSLGGVTSERSGKSSFEEFMNPENYRTNGASAAVKRANDALVALREKSDRDEIEKVMYAVYEIDYLIRNVEESHNTDEADEPDKSNTPINENVEDLKKVRDLLDSELTKVDPEWNGKFKGVIDNAIKTKRILKLETRSEFKKRQKQREDEDKQLRNNISKWQDELLALRDSIGSMQSSPRAELNTLLDKYIHSLTESNYTKILSSDDRNYMDRQSGQLKRHDELDLPRGKYDAPRIYIDDCRDKESYEKMKKELLAVKEKYESVLNEAVANNIQVFNNIVTRFNEIFYDKDTYINIMSLNLVNKIILKYKSFVEELNKIETGSLPERIAEMKTDVDEILSNVTDNIITTLRQVTSGAENENEIKPFITELAETSKSLTVEDIKSFSNSLFTKFEELFEKIARLYIGANAENKDKLLNAFKKDEYSHHIIEGIKPRLSSISRSARSESSSEQPKEKKESVKKIQQAQQEINESQQKYREYEQFTAKYVELLKKIYQCESLRGYLEDKGFSPEYSGTATDAIKFAHICGNLGRLALDIYDHLKKFKSNNPHPLTEDEIDVVETINKLYGETIMFIPKVPGRFIISSMKDLREPNNHQIDDITAVYVPGIQGGGIQRSARVEGIK